jgi:hypothetical protein
MMVVPVASSCLSPLFWESRRCLLLRCQQQPSPRSCAWSRRHYSKCVYSSTNSSLLPRRYLHDSLTQPTTGVLAHYAVSNRNASASATKNCQLGLCNIRSQVPSRFFDQDSDRDSDPVRIVGVALLKGSDDAGPSTYRVQWPPAIADRRCPKKCL